MINIDDEESIGQATHILNTTNTALELRLGTGQHERFFLGQVIEGTIRFLGLQLFQALDGATNSLVIGKHAAQPAMVYVGHTCSFRLLPHQF